MDPFLPYVGWQRDAILQYRQKMAAQEEFRAFDIHRVISFPADMASGKQAEQQVNALCLFSLGERGMGMPRYYRQYPGKAPNARLWRACYRSWS